MGDGAPFHQHFKELIFSGIYLPVIKKNLVICVFCVSTTLQSYGKCVQIRVMTYQEVGWQFDSL